MPAKKTVSISEPKDKKHSRADYDNYITEVVRPLLEDVYKESSSGLKASPARPILVQPAMKEYMLSQAMSAVKTQAEIHFKDAHGKLPSRYNTDAVVMSQDLKAIKSAARLSFHQSLIKLKATHGEPRSRALQMAYDLARESLKEEQALASSKQGEKATLSVPHADGSPANNSQAKSTDELIGTVANPLNNNTPQKSTDELIGTVATPLKNDTSKKPTNVVAFRPGTGANYRPTGGIASAASPTMSAGGASINFLDSEKIASVTTAIKKINPEYNINQQVVNGNVSGYTVTKPTKDESAERTTLVKVDNNGISTKATGSDQAEKITAFVAVAKATADSYANAKEPFVLEVDCNDLQFMADAVVALMDEGIAVKIKEPGKLAHVQANHLLGNKQAAYDSQLAEIEPCASEKEGALSQNSL